MIEHGTNHGYLAHFVGPYADGESCPPCRAAHATYRRNLWRRKYLSGTPELYVDATGIKRRIHALQRMGWRFKDVAREAGYKGNHPAGYIQNMMHQKKIHLTKHAAISGAYDRLCMKWGPSYLTAAQALTKKYPAPLEWDDETIDDPKAKPQGFKDRRNARTDLKQRYGMS